MNIGIVGAENSHTVAIARTINIQKQVRGFRVTHVWGESPRFAKDAQERGEIPNIVRIPEEMVGQIDAALVDLRHPKFHLSAVWPLLEARIPLFVDKPFCYRLSEGKRFLAQAHRLKVPVCSFSVLPKQSAFAELKKEVKKIGKIISVVSTGPCDIKSKHGGVFFYGIHQIDMVVRLLDHDVTHAQINRGKNNHTATLFSASGAISTVNFVNDVRPAFHASVIGQKGRVDKTIQYDDNPYLSGIRSFTRMFKTGKTDETDTTILTPVAVLEALEKSLKQTKRIKVATIT